jgi:ATP-dependent helicase/nuclease subunit A
MTRVIPIDQASREKVIVDHRTLFSVEAGAGTGKTTLLASRYAEIVRKGTARPTEIVAITFTEKAAQELRDRIRRRLMEEKLNDAAEELDRAQITTIHSFAASLLKERPFEAAIDPNFTVLDELDLELLMHDAYRRWLPRALQNTGSPITRALSAGIHLDRIRKLAFGLYRSRDLLGSLALPEAPTDIPKLFQEIAATAQELYQSAHSSCRNRQDAGFLLIETLRFQTEYLREASIDMQERALLRHLKISAAKGNQANWDPGTLKRIKERLTPLAEKVKEVRPRIRNHLFTDLLLALKTFVEVLEDEKQAAGKLDFDDLLLKSRDLICKNDAVRSYFQDRYRCFLVDEFQDTDPVQAELVVSLCRRDKALLPGAMFLVGDPKQSIYRFRRADLVTYRTVTHELERVVIGHNFRSSPPMIDWFNRTFSQVLKDEYEPLTADSSRRFDADRKPVIVLDPPEVSREKIHRIRQLEAESIAAFLADRLLQKDLKVQCRKTAELRPIEAGDIAILFPSTTEIDLFEEQLRKYGLPFSLEGGKMFYGRSEVQALVQTLDAIEHPADSVAVASSLRSSFFGLSNDDLLSVQRTEASLDYRRTDLTRLAEPAASAIRILRTFHERRQQLTPSNLISELLTETFAIPVLLARYHGEQAASNIEKLLSLTRKLEAKRNLTLADLVRWVRERSRAEEQQDESPLSDDSSRIRLMTIHKAKGLEFPLVVLANLGGKTQAGRAVQQIADRKQNQVGIGIGSKDERFCTANYEALLEQEKTALLEERKRLLYVGATRARDYLVLPRFFADGKTSEFWEWLEATLPHSEPLVDQISTQTLTFIDEPQSTKTITPVIEKSYLEEREELLTKLRMRSASWKTGLPIVTATSLVPHVEPNEFQRRAFEAAEGGTSFGSALHAVFEQLDFQDLTNLPEICAWIAQTELGDLSRSSELEDMVHSAQKSPLFARIANAKKVLREVPFSWWSEAQLYEGVIDLVIEEDDGLTIVDYKSDRVNEIDLPERMKRYRPQIELYARALTALSDKPVKESNLFFVRLGKSMRVE